MVTVKIDMGRKMIMKMDMDCMVGTKMDTDTMLTTKISRFLKQNSQNKRCKWQSSYTGMQLLKFWKESILIIFHFSISVSPNFIKL